MCCVVSETEWTVGPDGQRSHFREIFFVVTVLFKLLFSDLLEPALSKGSAPHVSRFRTVLLLLLLDFAT